MKYSIKVNEVKNNEGSLKGFATVVFGDAFKVTNIAILERNDGQVFVSMPRYKTNQLDEKGQEIYKDVCNPITKEFRESLYTDIIVAFETKENVVKEAAGIPKVGVSVTPFERDGSNMKGLARVVLDDCFIINNVTILESRNGNNFVAMPGYKTNQKDEQGKDVYKDICYPVTKEFRDAVYGELLGQYEEEKMKAVEQVEEEKKEIVDKQKKVVAKKK